jgi:hypothetical protein
LVQEHRHLAGQARVVVPVTKALTNEEQALFDNGRQTYAGLCAACHQPTGKGLEGLAPPLAESEWVLGEPERIVKVVMHGLRGAHQGEGHGLQLRHACGRFPQRRTDRRRAHVCPSRMGSRGLARTVELVKQIRAETKGRTDAWTEPELMEKK